MPDDPDEVPAVTGTAGAKTAAAKPFEDRQLLRAMDILRAGEVWQKYQKGEPVIKVEPKTKVVASKKAA